MVAENDLRFDVGDTVLVRYRERNKLVAKFIGTIKSIEDGIGPGSKTVVIDPPWKYGHVRIKTHEAEFERVEDAHEVSF